MTCRPGMLILNLTQLIQLSTPCRSEKRPELKKITLIWKKSWDWICARIEKLILVWHWLEFRLLCQFAIENLDNDSKKIEIDPIYWHCARRLIESGRDRDLIRTLCIFMRKTYECKSVPRLCIRCTKWRILLNSCQRNSIKAPTVLKSVLYLHLVIFERFFKLIHLPDQLLYM